MRFEPLGEERTRVAVRMTCETEGVAESAGAAVGVDERGVKADLKRFKDFVERGAETGAWRGEVREGEVTS